jgi:hypothetical protein
LALSNQIRAESPPHTKRAREYTCSRSIRAGAAAGPGRSSPDAHREVCDGLTPINLASCARENTFARYRTRCSDKGSSAATPPLRAAPTAAAFWVGALFAGVLPATFSDALSATAVLFVAISPLYPIFFVGCNERSTTGPRRPIPHRRRRPGEAGDSAASPEADSANRWPRSDVEDVVRPFPFEGFHALLARTGGRWVITNPLRPLPMFRW